jgi:hypothetical protein
MTRQEWRDVLNDQLVELEEMRKYDNMVGQKKVPLRLSVVYKLEKVTNASRFCAIKLKNVCHH